MVKAKFTCNCYEPMFREDVTVTADTFDDAWNKAKERVAKKYKAKVEDVAITASFCTVQN